MNDWTVLLHGYDFLSRGTVAVAAPFLVWLLWDMRRALVDIRDNHLPHIYDRIGEMQEKIAKIEGYEEGRRERGTGRGAR